tara:strand:- start:1888 stop:2055 length:168 start_codon:yes stop_codon:yes gene_type:complete
MLVVGLNTKIFEVDFLIENNFTKIHDLIIPQLKRIIGRVIDYLSNVLLGNKHSKL